jgi:hypothetical protein
MKTPHNDFPNDAVVDLFPGPHEAVLEILEDVDLSGPLRSIFFPPAPVCVVVEVILSRAGLEDLMPALGPGEFIVQFGHGQ